MGLNRFPSHFRPSVNARYHGLQVPCNSTLTNYNHHKWHHLNSDWSSSDFQVLFADKWLTNHGKSITKRFTQTTSGMWFEAGLGSNTLRVNSWIGLYYIKCMGEGSHALAVCGQSFRVVMQLWLVWMAARATATTFGTSMLKWQLVPTVSRPEPIVLE